VAHPKNPLGWPTLSILKGGSLFAFERPEPGGVLRDSPFFDFPISLFSPIRRGPVWHETWDVAHPLHASCSLIADCCSQLMRSGAEESAAPPGLGDFWWRNLIPPLTQWASFCRASGALD